MFRGLLVVCAMMAACGMSRAAEKSQPYGRATVAPFKAAPTIDGKIAPGEWDGAVATTGFQYLFTGIAGRLEPRSGTTYVGYHGDRIYIAIVSDYPPTGKLHSSGVNRDKDYVFDEGIEIWLDPNRGNRESQQGDLRFYQMNANAEGGIYDISFDPKTGPDTGWNGDWTFENHVDFETFTWTAELSLPMADLGWQPSEATGKTLGVLISRNFKQPWQQVTWFPVLGAFVDWYRYAAIELTEDAPTVQITDLGDRLHQGELQLRSTIFNPGPARQAIVKLHITSSDMPELREEKILDLPAGGQVEYTYDVPPSRLHEDAQHHLDLLITQADSGRILMDYEAKWTKAPEKIWHYHTGPNPEAAFRFSYYPSYRFVRVMIDTRELSKEIEDASKGARITISGPNGQVLQQTLTLEKPPYQTDLEVGDLPDGEYTIEARVDGWDDPFVRTFTRQHFPWEGSNAGVTDKVLAPFTPMQVVGNTVSVIYRDHELDGLGLWRSVKAAGNVNAGGPVELLAAPMALIANGAALEGRGSIVRQAENEVIYEGQAATPQVTVKNRTITEYDGCMRVELTLEPGSAGGPLNSLHLDIPLQDALMPLYHISTTALRINPAGATPSGDGVIWQSSNFPDGNWHSNFKCYIWLGAEERGFSFFADNDAGWVLQRDGKGAHTGESQQLIRQDGALILRINLVQAPITITEPRTIVFGLMASPAKPMRDDWRRTGLDINSQFNMGYCTPATYSAKYPWGGDFRIADWSYARRAGKPVEVDRAGWMEKNFPADMDPDFRKSAENLAFGWLGNCRPDQVYFKMYFEEFHSTWQGHPESHVFQGEWTGRWNSKLLGASTKADHKGWSINTGGIVDSYIDFATWYSREWAKRGVGSYFDNAFPIRAYDLLTTSAYRMDDGRIQPSAGMWARREYLKRVWVIHRLYGPEDAKPAMMIHMTNTHIVPFMVWNDENLDLEWKFGPEIQQTKFHYDFLRAETLGRQSGNVPWALNRIMDAPSKEDEAKAVRTRFGSMFVHEIRWWDVRGQDRAWYQWFTDFGYGSDRCRVYNYWNDAYPATFSDPEVKSLLLVNESGEGMLLLCTWNPSPAEVDLQLDLTALGISASQLIDREDETTVVALNTGSARLSLDGYGVRIFHLK